VLGSQVEDDLRDRVVSEGVQRCKMGEVGLIQDGRR